MALFPHRGRGLFDFLVCALCMWAAWHHTPAGALVRKMGAWAFGSRSTARPLLAYYGGATGQTIRTSALPNFTLGDGVLPPEGITSEVTLGYGVFAAVEQLEPAARKAVEARAIAAGVAPALLRQPAGYVALMAAVSASWPSESAAVLSVFAGRAPVAYAQERVLAEQSEITIDRLAAHLPPGLERETVAASQALAFTTAYALRWPVSDRAPITSPFGYRIHPVLGSRRLHAGVDLGVPTGTSVLAVSAGVVRRASEDNVNGRVLVIDHGHGVTTAYCHNQALKVEVGDRVEQGEVVALSGNTGRSTGPHLHYQVEITDQPVDPLRFRARAPALASDG